MALNEAKYVLLSHHRNNEAIVITIRDILIESDIKVLMASDEDIRYGS